MHRSLPRSLSRKKRKQAPTFFYQPIANTRDSAAKTALLLDNTQLGPSQVHVSSASSIDDIASKAPQSPSAGKDADGHDIAQEDKPRSRIVAEYLAHGYTISDTAIHKAIALDNKHGISARFTSALANFDQKYKATDKAKSVDASYGVTDKAMQGWRGLNSYFEKALESPTGQKVRSFYVQSDKQVRDIHNEARRLANLKAGKNEPETVAGTDKTVCNCGADTGNCPCEPGKCACANCGKASESAKEEVEKASGGNQPKTISGTDKTVCNCGADTGNCPCEPGKCACANCGKASDSAKEEVQRATATKTG
jgi:hypothetical protein